MNEKHTSAVTAFLSIKTQFDNLGDALINRELCRLVADRVEAYVDFSRAPDAFRRSMQVSDHPNLTVLQRWGFVRLLMKMIGLRLTGRRCYFFLNPGGLGGGKKPLKSLLAALTYNIVLTLLRAVGVRLCHVGISYDAMGMPERLVAAWRRRLLFAFAVRDSLSADYVQRIGMASDEVVPDLSFNLYALPVLQHVERHKIAFSFRFDGKSDDHHIEHAVRQVMSDLGPGHDYLFVVQVARDEAGMRRLHDLCMGQGQTRLLVCHENIDDLARYYAGCQAIYSNRLHALLLAAHAGASPYALVSRGRQPKIESMFNDLGIGNRVLHVDQPALTLPAVAPLDYQRFMDELHKLQDYFDRLLESH